MKQFYGFLEVRDGLKQVYFDEIVIEAEGYVKARRAFHYWLALKAMEDVPDGDDHAEFMDIVLAPKRAKNLKPKEAKELISEVIKVLGEVGA